MTRTLKVLLAALFLGVLLYSCQNRRCDCKCASCKQSYHQQRDYYSDDSEDAYQEWIDNNARWDPSM